MEVEMHEALLKESARLTAEEIVDEGEEIQNNFNAFMNNVRDLKAQIVSTMTTNAEPRKRWHVAVHAASLVTVGAILLISDAGPLWSSQTRQAIYLKNPPQVVERIQYENGKIWLITSRHESGPINHVISRRELTQEQVCDEAKRIMNQM